MTQPFCTIQNLTFRYAAEGIETAVLRGINLNLHKGIFACLAGPSGSGKTTLLNILGLIETGWEGEVSFLNQNLKQLSEKQLNHIRLFELGFVFQHFNLFPILSSFENVEYFLVRQGVGAAERKKIVLEALDNVGLADFRNKKPHQLSGGQRQRVSIARALAKRPKVILADEPTASLDQETGRQVIDLMLKLNAQTGTSFLIASHDKMVMSLAHSTFHMRDGQILSEDKHK